MGGEDFDTRVTAYLLKQYTEKTKKVCSLSFLFLFLRCFFSQDASNDKRAVQKLRRKVEDAKKGIAVCLLVRILTKNKKKALSTQHQVDIEIDSFHEGKDFAWKLTRAKFEELNIDLFKKTLEPVKVENKTKTSEIASNFCCRMCCQMPNCKKVMWQKLFWLEDPREFPKVKHKTKLLMIC